MHDIVLITCSRLDHINALNIETKDQYPKFVYGCDNLFSYHNHKQFWVLILRLCVQRNVQLQDNAHINFDELSKRMQRYARIKLVPASLHMYDMINLKIVVRSPRVPVLLHPLL